MTAEVDLSRAAGSAACRDADADVFFPVGRDPLLAETAKSFCRRCPAQRPCLAYALTHAVDGVWGATTLTEREELRDRHHIVAEPIELDDLVPHPTTQLEEVAS
jgi:WhiB family redox-sensing transcriptional regulator